MEMCRISMDYDCPTTVQWIARGGYHVWRRFVAKHVSTENVSWEEAEKLREMAKGIPGWHSGNTGHPHPVKFEDIDVED